MEISSTEESELETDEEEKVKAKPTAPLPMSHLKRRKLTKEDNKEIARKKLKSQTVISGIKSQQIPAVRPEEVFDQNNSIAKKSVLKFQLTGPSTVNDDTTTPQESVQKPQEMADESGSIITQQEGHGQTETPVQEGGFGKLEPVANLQKTHESSGEEEGELGDGRFISSRTLRRGRLSHRERKEYNVFKNYQSGEPNTRLYVKNLTKQTMEKDLHYIFGKYVNWENETEKNMFDIRLLREGRMKGQCFITFGSTKKAEDALNDTNGYMLNGKPMVVQFARSAKVKDAQDTKDKSNSSKQN